jgi:uncharacterized membrane protein YgdD (TMEM256/DUF423 family)
MSTSGRATLIAAGLLLALATALGAVGTHVLRPNLSAEQLDIYDTAVRYHFFNALGLLGVGAVARTFRSALLRWAAALILTGIVLFCGGLYAGVFGVQGAVRILPPFGGMTLITGWLLFAVAIWRKSPADL